MATTYSAAGQAGLAVKIQGLREAKAAFQKLPEITRDAMNVATFTTVSEIARLAKGRVLASPSVQTRALYNAIGFSVTPTNGRGRAGIQNVTTSVSRVNGRNVKVKGIVTSSRRHVVMGGALVRNPRRYAHLVEFGSRKMKAEPFMLPAAESQKQPYLDRCMKAGKVIEQQMAAIGGRLL